jgi:hypothetical protein
MQVAIIGWGSLISSPGILGLQSRWHRDGPLLPVEFARISSGDRLTLVIQREGTPRLDLIHTASADGVCSDGIADSVKESMSIWLRQKPDLSGCVWTGLTGNWEKERKCVYTPADAVQYLRGLDDPARAREYVQTTPSQIQTEARTLIRAQLGWQDVELPDVLFENV